MTIKSRNAAIKEGGDHARIEPITHPPNEQRGGSAYDRQESQIGRIICRREDGEDDRGIGIGKEDFIDSNRIRRIGEGIKPDNRPIIGRPEII